MVICLVSLTGIQGNIIYTDIDIDKEKRRKFEDILQDKYGELAITQFGMPSSAPPEIPRILITSQKYNFQIQVSKVMLQINVSLNEIIGEMTEKHLEDTIDGMKTLLGIYHDFSNEILYVGVMTNYVRNIDDGVQYILSKCFNVKQLQNQDEIFDIMGRVTYVEDKLYYKNVTIGNVRDQYNKKDMIGISYDVNDRYRYNYKTKSMMSPADTLSKILEIHKKFIADDFGKLLS